MENSEKLKVIANEFVNTKSDLRPYSEVYEHMSDWASKGWLSQAFIDDCYKAISDGKAVMFNYTPGKHYLYLCGKDEKSLRQALSKIK